MLAQMVYYIYCLSTFKSAYGNKYRKIPFFSHFFVLQLQCNGNAVQFNFLIHNVVMVDPGLFGDVRKGNCT